MPLESSTLESPKLVSNGLICVLFEFLSYKREEKVGISSLMSAFFRLSSLADSGLAVNENYCMYEVYM